ncbi:MAG: acylphosphatase, partial [bacterium]|nr:acylphosphatase [bacterium]
TGYSIAMPQAAMSAIISGRVQMVLYRDFAQRKGHQLGIVGEVRNLSDGTVSVVAEGPKEKLESFVLLLQKGPMFSKVENVSIQWWKPKGAFDGFSIKY